MKKLLIITGAIISSAMVHGIIGSAGASKRVNNFVDQTTNLAQSVVDRYKALKSQAEAYNALRNEIDLLEMSAEAAQQKMETYVDIESRLNDLEEILARRAKKLKKSIVQLKKDTKMQAINDLQNGVKQLKDRHGDAVLKAIQSKGLEEGAFVIGISANTEIQNARDMVFQALDLDRKLDDKGRLSYFELLGVKVGDSPAEIEIKSQQTIKNGEKKLKELPTDVRQKALEEYRRLVSTAVEELAGQE